MSENDYKGSVATLRLANGALFPIPVTLDVSKDDIERLKIAPGSRIALRDPRDDEPLAVITGQYTLLAMICTCVTNTLALLVEDIYQPDKVKEAVEVFGADDPAHPSVAYLRSRVKDYYIGGKVQAIQLPTYHDYVALRC